MPTSGQLLRSARQREAALQCVGEATLVAGDESCKAAPSPARQRHHVWGIEAATSLATTTAGLVRDISLGFGPKGVTVCHVHHDIVHPKP